MFRNIALSLLLLVMWGAATPVSAQTTTSADRQRQVGLYKMLTGAGMVGLGAWLIASSSESATITSSDPFFGTSTIKVSARSTTALVTGNHPPSLFPAPSALQASTTDVHMAPSHFPRCFSKKANTFFQPSSACSTRYIGRS